MFLLCAVGNAAAQGDSVVTTEAVDTALTRQEAVVVATPKRKLSWWRRVIRGFSRIDTNYIEPQKYNYTVMLQNTTSFEGYTLRGEKGETVRFSPRPSYKLGPYFGWRWLFLGYTIDLRATKGGPRQSIDLSLYANQVGIDFFYRKSGDNYRVQSLKLGSGYNTSAMHNVDFSGFASSERGINVYYIFNHKRFSYPAAYSQSTVQRRSCGSALAGFSYSRHALDIDWQQFYELVDEKLGEGTAEASLDTTYQRSNVQYRDYSLSGGYAYNWVFAKNWLFDVSLLVALAYKQSHGDINTQRKGIFRDFDFHNFNIDGVARTGLVWNNMRWYFGASAIFHTYNYKRNRFRTNTTFGNLNIYVGYNFGKR